MIEPVSLTVAVAGVAVAGAQLAVQGHEVRRKKKNKKQEGVTAAQYPYSTQTIVPSQSAVNQYTPGVGQANVLPYAYGGQANVLPNGFNMNGLNSDGAQGWATITTSETVFIENGRPVTKESKLELYQSAQYPQTHPSPSAVPVNMSQQNQMPQSYSIPSDAKPLMLPPPASDSKPPTHYSMPSDSKPPMLPLHCTLAQEVPTQGQAPWQQTAPPPPYQEYVNAPTAMPRIRKRDRWVHFK